MTGKTALILGIGGQDGAYLSQLLLSKGYEVHGTSRNAPARDFSGLIRLGIREQVDTHTAALNDVPGLRALLEAVQPDEVYNLSGQSSVAVSFEQPAETFDSIASTTVAILESIRLTNRAVRLFTAISSECFGNTAEPATEATAFRPRSPYAAAKAAAFWMVANYREAYGIPAGCGILFNHESPLRPSRFVTRKIVAAAVRIARGSRERLRLGNLSVARDWGWAPDYVDAMWRMLQLPAAEDFIIATGATHSLEQFLDLAFREAGLDWHDHVDIDETLLRPADIRYSAADPGKAREKLGWWAVTGLNKIVRVLVDEELQRLGDGLNGT